MALPDLSNSIYVAHLRYIQSVHESPEYRNPDTMVRRFLTIRQWWRAAHLSREELAELRGDPFYYYLLARTRYYDEVFKDAVAAGVKQIISIGCGSDTRPYRFKDLLYGNGVKVLECDQREAIQAKRRIVKWWGAFNHITYLPIDLNDDAWPELRQRLSQWTGTKVLMMLEGVSPYVNDSNFCRFLRLTGTSLAPGSHVAYDFKIRGIKQDFGRVGRTQAPFRLPKEYDAVARFHEEHGFRLREFELSSELSTRLARGAVAATVPLFMEDGLVRLEVNRA